MNDKFIPVMRFAVCSDSHIEGIDSAGYKRLKKAVDTGFSFAENDMHYNKLDAFFCCR